MTLTSPIKTVSDSKIPAWALPSGWIVVTAFLALAPVMGLLGGAWMRQILLVMLMALIVSGLNISWGFAGELSFASAAMYAAGAYTTAYFAMNLWNDLVIALVASAISGLILGLISGIPGLRLGGWMLATSSLFLVLLVPDIVDIFEEQLGGDQGLPGIPRASIFGFQLDNIGLYVATIIITSLWFVLYRNLVKSRTGNAFAVMRHSSILSNSVGISVYSLKLKAYSIAGLPAALAGCLFAYLDGFIAPEAFGVNFTIGVLAAAILGGRRSIYGVFLGAAIMQLGPLRTTVFGDFALIVYGILLVAVGVLLPGGLGGAFTELRSRLSRGREKLTTKRSATAPTDPVVGKIPGKVLAVSGVSKNFGGLAALSDVSFEASPGEVVALIGPNGSGKTTLLNVINGFYNTDAGNVKLGDATISSLSASRTAGSGVTRTFQTPSVPDLTVREAVATALYSRDRVSIIETMLRLPRYRAAVARDREEVDLILEATGLSDVADAQATSLPLGTRRMLELARSLVSRPALVLLDEIASGLDEEEIASLSAIIRAVRDAGGTVLLVEHNFSLVRDLADRVVVLSQGRLVTTGTPDEISTHPEVIQHYLGEPVESAASASLPNATDEDEHFLEGQDSK
ncbi:branched-chain amino acid ABC transporter ATP-binding protein/permease [Microbacterium sp. NPDC077644]|uniref:branched-chain amino acid ABC transporter ATP-binding protein/permease n=1 Tax=Microbacterium sp. NPDC077644 TaxID=3155055 RepID=UPI00344FEB24